MTRELNLATQYGAWGKSAAQKMMASVHANVSASRSPDLESLLPQGHPARLCWDCVSSVEVAPEIIKVAHGVSSPIPLFALWLFAAFRGVGSVEELAWLCQNNIGFRWLSSGLAVDAKVLAAFREAEPQATDELLAKCLVALRALGASPGDKTASGDGDILARFAEAHRKVAVLRQQLGAPLGQRLRRRQEADVQRRAARVARVDSALADFRRLELAREAEQKRLAEQRIIDEKRLAEQRQSEARRLANESPQALPAGAAKQARPLAPSRPASGPRRFVALTSLDWGSSDNTEGLFKRILIGVMVGFFAVSVALLTIKPAPVERQKVENIPQRLTKLFEEQKAKPQLEKPKLVESVKPKDLTPQDIKPSESPTEPTVTAKSESKPVARADSTRNAGPSADEVAAARTRASQTGLVAMKDQLSALRSLGGANNFRQDQIVVGAGMGGGTGGGGSGPGGGERDLIARAATQASGGVAGRSVDYAGGGTLGGRAVTRVTAPGGGGGAVAAAAQEAKRSGKRSGEDIKLAFDANKSAIYGIYRRALRQNPLLEGRVVLKLSIDKSGKVTACSIASSALNDPDLEEKLVARVMLIEFAPQPSAETWTGTYQIDFVPAS